MRLKIVGYYCDSELAPRYEFECLTDRHDDFVSVSMFKLIDAAGLPREFTTEQARSLIGKEFDLSGRLNPVAYYCSGELKPATDERWKDLGETVRCDRCDLRFCECGPLSKPIAA
jgi:hypothetical protein